MSEAAPAIAGSISLYAVPGIPILGAGDDVAGALLRALDDAGEPPAAGDIFAVTSKLFSRAEGRFVDLSTLSVGDEARALAVEVDKDPALVQLVLNESAAVSRKRRGALITRHRLGLVSANAAIDASNAAPPNAPPGSGPWALLLPEDPDASARRLRDAVEAQTGVRVGIVVTDSLGRPFRLGTVGAAIGVAGVPALFDQVGRADLFGRPLQFTTTAIADQIAAAADLVAGQADEARPIVRVRGIRVPDIDGSGADVHRDPETDLYA